jgi:hypothetical protein
MMGGVGDGVCVFVVVGGMGVIDGVSVRVGSGVRLTAGVAVARGVSVTSGASVLVAMSATCCCGVHDATITAIPATTPARTHFRNPLLIRTIRGMTLIFLLLIVFVPAFAQGDSTISLNSNRTAVLRLAGDGEFASAVYTASGGETVTIRADSGGALDAVLELIGPDGSTVVYADATDNERPSIMRVMLDEAGDYIIRVNTFNGEGSGEVEVTLTVEPPLALTPDSPAVWVPLGANAVATVLIDGFNGDATITVRDPKGLLDPRVEIVDADSAVIAANDDHGTADVSLNRFDARLTAAIPDGAAVQITEFLGRAGWVEVSINP